MKTAITFIFAAIVLLQLQGNDAYLARFGPPPLRFSPTAGVNPLFAKSAEAKTVPVTPDLQSAVTNAGVSVLAASTNDMVLTTASGNSNPVSVISSSEALTVTPQMLVAFLKPAPGTGGTNAAAGAEVLIPADVGFTPPTPAQSRATYKTQ